MPALQFILADHVRNGALSLPTSSPEDIGGWVSQQWETFLACISQPYVWPVFLAWIVTFWVILLICLGLGFGPIGIIGGSLAAALQSYMYGGFTPAGGIFATLTSMAMLGALVPVLLVMSVVIASLVAAVVWLSGAGR
ncbi:hypothetical protein B0T25DRAFT_568891 [Lasiosphaeria hispida]|uniref:Uncharacterized protein n=1 Tax=Lasiosphaeria hispida TaxID=260671 RepID=A0AAJ0HJ70_9PEZI|nr:hypothetical protein B0T25DRAFT_568891 [Lasiosphaeria hispida]